MTSGARKRSANTNRAQFWANRYAAAPTLQARVLVALSEAQARIARLPAARQPTATKDLERLLRAFNPR